MVRPRKDWIKLMNLIKRISRPTSLQSQLIIGIWLGMGSILIPYNIFSFLRDRDYAIQSLHEALLVEGTTAALSAKKWQENIINLTNVVSFTPSARRLSQAETQLIFDDISKLFPDRILILWARDGLLIASTEGINRPETQAEILRSKYFQESLKGNKAWGITKNCLTKSACYINSTPVYGLGQEIASTSSTQPVGVLTTVIKLTDTAHDSGMDAEAILLGKGEGGNSEGPLVSASKGTLSLQKNKFTGLEILIVNKDGHVIFPLSQINDEVSTQDPAEVISGPWGPIVKAGQAATTTGEFKEIEARGHQYLTYTKKINTNWSIVAVNDKASSVASVYQQVIESALRQLLVLILMTLVVIINCRKAAKPVRVAAAAVREFRIGNFDGKIVSNKKGEIGLLYDDINETGKQLRVLLNERLANAITNKQVQIAADIQQEFVIQTLPSTKLVDLAADFDPAYEVGADWYDAICLGDLTYVVIADVCDKGIASALFMSVFRSLLHYSILEESKDDENPNEAAILENSTTQVNDYMAKNHGQSAIFATIFIGAYNKKKGRLSYVCAGHETPLIIRSLGVTETLEISGPAVGIFPGSRFTAKTTDLGSGEILFTFTDGLIDARSPDGKAWGIERLKTMLETVDPTTTTAGEILTNTLKQVNTYRSSAEQFDDMTMLVMKINA